MNYLPNMFTYTYCPVTSMSFKTKYLKCSTYSWSVLVYHWIKTGTIRIGRDGRTILNIVQWFPHIIVVLYLKFKDVSLIVISFIIPPFTTRLKLKRLSNLKTGRVMLNSMHILSVSDFEEPVTANNTHRGVAEYMLLRSFGLDITMLLSV